MKPAAPGSHDSGADEIFAEDDANNDALPEADVSNAPQSVEIIEAGVDDVGEEAVVEDDEDEVEGDESADETPRPRKPACRGR